jgi:glycosyltransferase involved in cell wall biosynthesis
MPKKPILSVVIPCFDEGNYLIESVQSVLQQSASAPRGLPEFELLVVNDRSKDEETLQAIEKICRMDSRIRSLQNSGKSGAAGARNTGINAAEGEWIAFLDADDLWLPNAIDVRWAVLDEYPDAEWISADFRIFHDHKHPGREQYEEAFFKSRPKPAAMLEDAFSENKTLRLEKPVSQFLECSLAWTGTVMAKRSLLLDLGGFDESLIRAQDTDLWWKLASKTDFFFVPHIIADYRQRESTKTNRGNPPGHWELIALRKLLKNPAFSDYSEHIRQRIKRREREDIYFYRTRGEWSKALKMYTKSLLHIPFN